MGLDFIRRAAPSFKKGWTKGAASMAQPTLFTKYPECRSRSIVVTVDDGAQLEVGAPYAIHVDGEALCVVKETARVGKAMTPPPDLFSAIKAVGGCALGRISKINPLSGTADVEIE
jgi:hypothetical protein